MFVNQRIATFSKYRYVKYSFCDQLMYYEFKMVDPALRKVHTETNQGEIFKVFEEENIFQFKALAECTTLPI